jgi:ABC-type Fe3+ transport system substrate-binding protein
VQRFVGVAQYQRFMQETDAKQYIADLLHVGDFPSMKDLVQRGLIAEWKVPTFDRIPEDAHLGTSSYTAYINDSIIAYNTGKVTPEEVELLKKWEGLLDPRFKGRMATTDQTAGGVIAPIQILLSPKYKDRYGWPFLEALAKQKIKIYSDVSVVADRVVAGEVDIDLFSSEGPVSAAYLKGAPVRWVHPKPAVGFGNTWFGIPNTATHPYAARLFLNWIMGDEGARSIETRYNGIPMLRGVPDERPAAKEPWYDPIGEQRETPDWDAWARGEAHAEFKKWVELMRASQ